MFRFAALLLLATLSFSLFAQKDAPKDKEGMYFVAFKNKKGTPYNIAEPEAYLSERALDRRAKHNSPITKLDLPVTPEYVNKVASTGATVWLKSKWMNGVVVRATDAQMKKIGKLSFVDDTYYTAPAQYKKTAGLPYIPNLDRPAPVVEMVPVNKTFYGAGYPNLARLGGDSLHMAGYRGAGMLVAVLDGGFPKVGYKDFLGYDDAAYIPAGWDVVEQDSSVYDGGTHGAIVLSTMAAHHPFFFVGMAPEARYVVFKTENGRGEHCQEEINFAIALEVADSIGVDVTNSSLGYTVFGDENMNYTYEDMNGRTSPASIAIDRAFDRGMICVTSAGNSGGDKWKYISAPADANKAFSIGALNADDDSRAYFSSFGPTADGRVKPDVSAPGVSIVAVDGGGRGLTGANGTSLSSPLVCALVTCLWQAYPDATNQEILDAIRNTASQADRPDGELGYGLPDFTAAYRYLATRP
ncbi:serine protease [Lewinellaceae bacterium SD302]|nr:serine protease [Lewinellaceae bacterium SD302]